MWVAMTMAAKSMNMVTAVGIGGMMGILWLAHRIFSREIWCLCWTFENAPLAIYRKTYICMHSRRVYEIRALDAMVNSL